MCQAIIIKYKFGTKKYLQNQIISSLKPQKVNRVSKILLSSSKDFFGHKIWKTIWQTNGNFLKKIIEGENSNWFFSFFFGKNKKPRAFNLSESINISNFSLILILWLWIFLVHNIKFHLAINSVWTIFSF